LLPARVASTQGAGLPSGGMAMATPRRSAAIRSDSWCSDVLREHTPLEAGSLPVLERPLRRRVGVHTTRCGRSRRQLALIGAAHERCVCGDPRPPTCSRVLRHAHRATWKHRLGELRQGGSARFPVGRPYPRNPHLRKAKTETGPAFHL